MAAVSNGFVIDGAPTERFTSNGGMEASVTFFGPAANRMQFLYDIFGQWDYLGWTGSVPDKKPQGVCLAKPPQPFVSMSETSPGGSLCFDADRASFDAAHGLWPDTWEIAPADPNSRSAFVTCVNPPTPSPVTHPMQQPIDYTCQCYITVHYRSKHHASWPLNYIRKNTAWGDPTGNNGGVPPIPRGTYLDVKSRASAEVQTMEGQGLKWGNPGSSGPSGIPGATWSAPANTIPPNLPTGVTVGILVSTTQIDVTWSNVPLPPWDLIDDLTGTVNAQAFLGYPPEAVCFMGADVTYQGGLGCMPLYSLHYNFIVKTAPVSIEGSPSSTDYINAKVTQARRDVGVWNRRLSSSTIYYGPSSSSAVVTNFVPIFSASGNKKPFETGDFYKLFQMQNYQYSYESVHNCP